MISLSLGMFLMYMFANTFLLEKYYMNTKEKSIISTYKKIDSILKSVDELDDDNVESITELCANTGITLLVTDEAGYIIYDYGNSQMMQHRLEMSVFSQYGNGTDSSPDNEKIIILEKNSKYVLQKYSSFSENNSNKSEYLEMWGIFNNGNIFIMRIAVENIQESVRIFGEFLLLISVVISIISIIIGDILARRFLRPLIKLTKISEKMSELDFNVHYEGESHDEISILGKSMNKLSNKLESTITELKKANNELKNDLKHKNEIDEMRKDFISNVSHELKTPIALIQGYAEGLQENINDDEESREFYCEVIIDEASKMNQMVKKLLTLTQLEFCNNSVYMERFNIMDVIRGVVNKCSLMIEQKDTKIEIVGNDDIDVWADEFQIEEVITNYVTNALNHVSNENIITITVIKKDDTVKVSVHNTGDKIPEKDIDRIWVKFYKVDKARTREYGGNGIGLSIVKAIIDAHNHECGVYNTETGVEFWFELDA